MNLGNKGFGPMSMSDLHYADEARLSVLLARGWSFFLRNRRLILSATLAGAVLSAFVVVTTEPQYRSKLLVMVDPPILSPLDPSEQAKRDISGFVDGQVYLIGSRSVLEPVLDVASLNNTDEFRQPPPGLVSLLIGGAKSLLGGFGSSAPAEVAEDATPESYALRLLRKQVSINRKGDTNMIEITAMSTSALRAARIANAVGDIYVENRQDAQLKKASRVSDWLDMRVLEIRQKLSQAEDEVTSYRIANDLISGDANSTLNEQQLVELNTELIRARAALSERRAAYARAQQLLADGGDIQSLPQLHNSDIITTLRARLLELEQRQAELLRMNRSDLRLGAIADERLTVESQLATEIQRLVAMLGHEVETLEAGESLLAAALADAGGRSGVENRNIVKLRELERVVQGYQALYERYIANGGMADEGVSELASGVEIVVRASVASKPDYPPSKLFVIWGILLGAAIGVILSRLREIARPGFVNSAQIEQELQAPVIAALPQIPKSRLDPLAVVFERPNSGYSQALRGLRLSLTDPLGAQPARIVTLIAARQADGAEKVAAGLAASAALAGQKVLLIDADLRHGRLSRAFGLQGKVGLSDVLGGGTAVTPTRFDTVDVLPSGQASASGDLLIGSAMQGKLQAWTKEYDLILISAPGLTESPDGAYLTKMADRTGYVVTWNGTPRRKAIAGLTQLPQSVGKAVILSGVNPARARSFDESLNLYARA